MGLFAALRDRLFGTPTVAPEADAPQPVEPAETQASVDEGEPASPESPPGDEMPRRSNKQEPANTPATDEAVAARQERAASRILEDERLRGDLTDDEFQPLLDWAMAAAERLVASTAGLSDERAEERIDSGLSAIRETVAAAGDAIAAYAEHDVDRLRKALADAGIGARDQRADQAIARLMIEQGQAGAEVAAQIAQRLGAVTADGPGERSSKQAPGSAR
jgi:hypothetical protein